MDTKKSDFAQYPNEKKNNELSYLNEIHDRDERENEFLDLFRKGFLSERKPGPMVRVSAPFVRMFKRKRQPVVDSGHGDSWLARRNPQRFFLSLTEMKAVIGRDKI